MNTRDYNQCVDKYADGVFRFILKSINDEDTAKDIVQDSFAKMWEKRKNIDSSKVKSYLFTTAYHTMIDYIRKGKKQTVDENLFDINKTSKNNFSDLSSILDLALDSLPEIQKAAILLRDYEGYSYREIGEIIKLNESQVKVYIYRGRLALRKYIGSIETVI